MLTACSMIRLSVPLAFNFEQFPIRGLPVTVENQNGDIIKKEDLAIDPDDKFVPSHLDTIFHKLSLDPLRDRLLKNAPESDVDKISNRINYLDELVNDDNDFFGAMALLLPIPPLQSQPVKHGSLQLIRRYLHPL